MLNFFIFVLHDSPEHGEKRTRLEEDNELRRGLDVTSRLSHELCCLTRSGCQGRSPGLSPYYSSRELGGKSDWPIVTPHKNK